eukprot:sb/3472372/
MVGYIMDITEGSTCYEYHICDRTAPEPLYIRKFLNDNDLHPFSTSHFCFTTSEAPTSHLYLSLTTSQSFPASHLYITTNNFNLTNLKTSCDQDASALPRSNCYVRVVGHLRFVKEQPSIMAFSIKEIKSHNEFLLHRLSVVRFMCGKELAPKLGSKLASSGGVSSSG